MKLTIFISPRRVTLVLAFVVLCLTLAHIAGQSFKYFLGHGNGLGFVPLFDLDGEVSVPTWYSSSALLLCSALLAGIALAKRIAGDRYALSWSALWIIFLYLSLDEGAQIHEQSIRPLRSAFNAGGFFYYTWVVPGAAFVFVFVLAYLKFLAHLPTKTRYLFLVAGALYVGGALGMELLGGRHADLYGIYNMSYVMLVTGEEVLEMLGVIVFIYALLSYLSSYLKDLHIHFGDERLASSE